LAIALGSLAVAATYEPADRAVTNLGSTVATRLANPPASATTLPSFTAEAELLAVGDVMMHGMQIKSGDRGGGTYHFDHFFAAVRDRLSAADWAVANLETVLGGGGAYTGYPMFNAPPALADALHNAGFDVITTANNHSLDRGAPGVKRTRQHLRDRGLIPVGTATTPAEAEEVAIVERNGISMAFLAYTYGTNGIPLPQGEKHWVSLIDEARIARDIGHARQQGADCIAVALHFGDEYQRQPNANQKRLVKNLLAAGADIILGSHPHVVQPYQTPTVTDANGVPRRRAVIYSLGNFVSNQNGVYRHLGVMFSVKVRKQYPSERVEITHVEAIPTWTHRYHAGGKPQFRVLALPQTLADRTDPTLPPSAYPQLATYRTMMDAHLRSLP
jgi:poly-gamma-glutamate synthesis protein (capsule biosynthesis protein)